MPQTIESWLQSLELGQYIELFIDNDIDMEVLSELSEAHLQQLGISLGHRLKILKAARENDNATNQLADESLSYDLTGNGSDRESINAERRQLTVMFVDLVGSTALSSRLDPEDLRRLMVDYQKAVAETLERFGGHVARYMGDGVLAYFGWPQAHEDAAERAVHAALSTVSSVERLSRPAGVEPLHTRVGVATGLVIVGDIIGTGEAREHAVVGETPNLAARLQGLARPQQVVISDGTKRLIEGSFELADIGMQQLKGIPQPVPAYTVTSVRRHVRRFKKSVTVERSIIGREAETAALMNSLQQTLRGQGQLVHISGEAGIGKSALVSLAVEKARLDPFDCLICQCSPYESDRALYPVADALPHWLEQWHVIGSTPGESLSRLVPREDAMLLAEMIGDRTADTKLSVREKRERTLAALSKLLLQRSQEGALLLLVEDAHWIDATTLEWLDRLVKLLSRTKILLLVTARKEFEHKFPKTDHMLNLELGRLQAGAISELVQQVCNNKAMPDSVVSQIDSRTDGVPLFVEEITKTLLESGQLEERDDRYHLTGPLQSIDIPGSLQDSLMARLERLQSSRGIAQYAACIGREFNLELLEVASGESDRSLQSALQRLIEAELVEASGTPRHYNFKHALVSDAAYESLLKSSRQTTHQKIAEYLATKPEYNDSPELTAHHYSAARMPAQALAYWQLASDTAIAADACVEATAYLERAMSEFRELPPTDRTAEHEQSLLLKLIDPLTTSRSFADTRALEVVDRALELGEQTGSMHELFPVLGMQIVQANNLARFPEAHRLARRYLELADSAMDELANIVARQMTGTCEFWCGFLRQGYESYRSAIFQYEQLSPQHAEIAHYAVINPKSNALCNSARILLILGYPDRARQLGLEGIQFSRDTGDAFSIGHALVFGGIELADMLQDSKRLNHCTDELELLAIEKGFGLWENEALVQRNRVKATSGDMDALRTLEIQAESDGYMRRCDFASIAQLHNSHGNSKRALHFIDVAIEEARCCGEKWYTPELYRIKGELLSEQSARVDDAAVQCFNQSIELARQIEARWWELRATTSLARHVSSQASARNDAMEQLQRVVEWFTQGFDTHDLQAAKALLS